jgi:hypothetical protein
MSDLVKKFSDHIRGASTMKRTDLVELADAIQAAVPSLDISQLKALERVIKQLIASDAAKKTSKA